MQCSPIRRSGRARVRAVIDIGSNTGRVVVFRSRGHGMIEILADDHFPLRLIREIDAKGRLKAKAVRRIVQIMHDFRILSHGVGAERISAFATAAVREAANGPELIRLIRRETGLKVKILEAAEEARYAFLGAVYGLPVSRGLLVDLGGGSLQVVRFRKRRLVRAFSLPLGALRLSLRFLAGDRPTAGGIGRLYSLVAEQWVEAGIPSLRSGDRLVGTGGTIRNLAKMDSRRHPCAIQRLHGYVLSSPRVEELVRFLTSRRHSSLASISGMNAARVDSITGGCLIMEMILELVGAEDLLVSGQGLREGILLDRCGRNLPAVVAVRVASVRDLTSRFAGWEAKRAARRAALATAFLRRLDPEASEEARALLRLAAQVMDIGRSIDYYRRHEHASAILRSVDLMGFSHREIAWISAVIAQADDAKASLKAYRPLLNGTDREEVTRAALLLALADEIEHRLPETHPARVRCSLSDARARLRSPYLAAWRPRELAKRFQQAFGVELQIGA